jgi:hypothetical protein
MENYNGDIWGNNGATRLSQVFHDNCKLPNLNITGNFRCAEHDFYVFARELAYAIHYSKALLFFNPNNTNMILNATKESHFVHLYSHATKKATIIKSLPTAFKNLTEELCPRIYELSDENFM